MAVPAIRQSQSQTVKTLTNSITLAQSTQVGSTIIVFAGILNPSTITGATPIDNMGNTYVLARASISNIPVCFWYCVNATPGVTSISVTAGGSAGPPFTLAVAEYTGIARSSALNMSSFSATTATSTTPSSGYPPVSQTIDSSNVIAIGMLITTGSATVGSGSSYTAELSNATSPEIMIEDVVLPNSIGNTYSADFTLTAAQTYDAGMLVFRPFIPTATQTATGHISNKLTATQSALACIGVTNTQIQNARAKIAKSVSKSQQTTARVANSFNASQTSLSRIASNITKTQSLTARIQRLLSATQTAKSAIVQSGEILKRYDYKVYEGSNYLGLLPDVVSEYGHAHEINSVGSQITIKIGQSPDVSGFPAYQDIYDETSANITDETDINLQSEGYPGIIGTEGTPSKLVKTGNIVRVIEYSSYYPNGKTMFVGKMMRWDATLKGDGDDISILVNSTGSDFDGYMVAIGDTTIVNQTDQTYTIATSSIYGGGLWQAIKPTGSAISVGKVKAVLGGGANPLYISAVLCQGDPTLDTYSVMNGTGTWALGSGNTQIDSSSNVAVTTSILKQYTFTFSQNRTLATGVSYYVAFIVSSNKAGVPAALAIATATTGTVPPAPLDKIYRVTADTNNVTYSPTYNSSFPVGTIELDTIGGNTFVHNVSLDPVAGLMPQIMDNYIAQGGGLKYDSSNSFQSSGLSLTFDLKMNTAYEALKTSHDLAPSDFYYYADLGTETLYEKQFSTTPDIILTRSKNVGYVTFSASIENVVNAVYFSGGKPSGSSTNLYKVYTDSTSISRYGQRLLKKSDNRVVLASTADAIGNSTLGSGKSEQYLTSAVVLDTMMDITTIKPGMIVGFRGYGSFYDSITLPIARVDYTPHAATLALGTLPPRVLPTYEKVLRDLQAQQTLDNPNTPS